MLLKRPFPTARLSREKRARSRRVTDLGDGLELEQLSRHDWRVSDARALATDPGRIIGFIERLSRDRFEVLWLVEPPLWAYIESFGAAVGAIIAGPARCGATVELSTSRCLTAAVGHSDHSDLAKRGWRSRV